MPDGAGGDDVAGRQVFRDRWATVANTVLGLVLLLGSILYVVAGHTAGKWATATLWALGAAAALAAAARSQVVVEGDWLILRSIKGRRRIQVADLAWIDPSLTGRIRRFPHLGLRSGEVVRLTQLLAPPAKTHSQAAEGIGRLLNLPFKTLQPPPGWYADPTSAAEYRHWDGAAWTSLVRDGTRRWTDDYRKTSHHHDPPLGYPIPDEPGPKRPSK